MPLRPLWSGSAFTHGSDARDAHFLARWQSGALLGVSQLRLPAVVLAYYSIVAQHDKANPRPMPRTGICPFPACREDPAAVVLRSSCQAVRLSDGEALPLNRRHGQQSFPRAGYCAAGWFGQGRSSYPNHPAMVSRQQQRASDRGRSEALSRAAMRHCSDSSLAGGEPPGRFHPARHLETTGCRRQSSGRRAESSTTKKRRR
jgi:hypothetical protein